jgi:hypothetical protein
MSCGRALLRRAGSELAGDNPCSQQLSGSRQISLTAFERNPLATWTPWVQFQPDIIYRGQDGNVTCNACLASGRALFVQRLFDYLN